MLSIWAPKIQFVILQRSLKDEATSRLSWNTIMRPQILRCKRQVCIVMCCLAATSVSLKWVVLWYSKFKNAEPPRNVVKYRSTQSVLIFAWGECCSVENSWPVDGHVRRACGYKARYILTSGYRLDAQARPKRLTVYRKESPILERTERNLTVVSWWLNIWLVALRNMFDHQLADRRVCACWVPHYLSENYKTPYMGLFFSCIWQVILLEETNFFFALLPGITRGFMTRHSKSGKTSMRWKHPLSSPTQTFSSNTIRKEDNGDYPLGVLRCAIYEFPWLRWHSNCWALVSYIWEGLRAGLATFNGCSVA